MDEDNTVKKYEAETKFGPGEARGEAASIHLLTTPTQESNKSELILSSQKSETAIPQLPYPEVDRNKNMHAPQYPIRI